MFSNPFFSNHKHQSYQILRVFLKLSNYVAIEPVHRFSLEKPLMRTRTGRLCDLHKCRRNGKRVYDLCRVVRQSPRLLLKRTQGKFELCCDVPAAEL